VRWSRTVVPRPVNIGDFEDRTRPMGRPMPSQALTTDHKGKEMGVGRWEGAGLLTTGHELKVPIESR
jgi:hypothetical protein